MSPARLEIRLLGLVEVVPVSGSLPPGMAWRKNIALLAYLACSPRQSCSRDQLIGLLWPEKDESRARHSLNVALHSLRQALGESAVESDALHVRLAPGSVGSDLERFLVHEAAARWAEAAALVAGEFLEGFDVPGASAFEDWLSAERTIWRTRSVRALTRAAAEMRERGDLDGALHLAERATALDPQSESAQAEVMLTLALDGGRTAALARYQLFSEQLQERLGASPGEAMAKLAERIRRERVWHLPAVAPAADPSRRAPLAGRANELGQLLVAWRQAVASRCATLLLLHGDSGTGKTRLVEELSSRMRLEGCGVAMVRAVEIDQREAGGTLLALARNGVLELPGIAAAEPEALVALGAILPEWRDRFGGRASAGVGIRAALTDVLRCAAEEGPIALILDDAHWADGESLEGFAALLRDLSSLPVAVLLAANEFPARPELETLGGRVPRDIPGVAVKLGPLDDAALTVLARWATPGFAPEAIDRLVRRLAVDSAGLPLLAVDLLHAVANGLDLSRVAGAWPEPFHTLTQTRPGQMPEAIVAAIRVGFRRLSPAAQGVLQAVAALGGRETRDILGRAAELTGEALDQALDELEWTRWLTADSRGYCFVAGITREIVASDLLTAGRRERLRTLAGISGRA